jgi:aspartyl protease family protein
MCTPAWATNVNVTGLFKDKALVSINGGKPKLLSVGQVTAEGVKLISSDSNEAVTEVDGQHQTLGLGQSISTAAPDTGNASVSLTASPDGHFWANGSINGVPVRFVVDTGASFVAISSSDAKNMGISYINGERSFAATANGTTPAYRVTFNTVKLGDITVNQVEGMVIEGAGLPVALLGMSFLKRLDMKREGVTMTLTKRY